MKIQIAIFSLALSLVHFTTAFAGPASTDYGKPYEVEITVFDNERNPMSDVPVFIYEQKMESGSPVLNDEGNPIYEKSTASSITNGDGRTRDLFAHQNVPFYVEATDENGVTYGGTYDYYYDRPNVWVSYDGRKIINTETDLNRLTYLHIFPKVVETKAPEVDSKKTYCGNFPDVDKSEVAPETCDAIDYVKNMGIFTGTGEGKFEPNRPINRAEVAKVMLQTFKIANLTDFSAITVFPDVHKSDWYHPYVMTARKEGIVGGYPDGSFKPENIINRVELLRMFEEGAGSDYRSQPSDSSYFTDIEVNDSTRWFVQYTNFAFANSYLDNVGVLAPSAPMDRVDVARLIFRALGSR